MNEQELRKLARENAQVFLMSKDHSNKYQFTMIKESEDRRFITFSICSTTDRIPFCNNDTGMAIKNGIFDYYIGEITVEAKYLSDNNLWDFVNQKYQ